MSESGGPAAIASTNCIFHAVKSIVTDGEPADDFFPPDEHLARLWADLTVNNIPSARPPADAAVAAEMPGWVIPPTPPPPDSPCPPAQ